MSLLGKIKNMFQDKQEEPLEELNLDEAIEKFNSGIQDHKEEILDNVYNISNSMYSKLEELHKALSFLENYEISDKRAEASKTIKDRFCDNAKSQIKSIEKPGKNIEDLSRFIEEVAGTMSKLGGLTPKQMMHIKFFFASASRNVSKKADEINKLLKEGKKEMASGKMKVYTKISETRKLIEKANNKIKEKDTAIEENKKYINNLEGKKKEIGENRNSTAAEDIENSKNSLKQAENSLNSVQQEIDSYLDVERILKKLKHEKQINDSIIDGYIESPSSTLRGDEEFMIISFFG